MEIKFTTDGKKVIVIGSLNSQEKIVQEIFIIDGSEIPSGEHFVVKSLHDAPAESWKEKELKRIESAYEKSKFHYDNELKVLTARYKTISQELKNKITYAGKVLEKVSPDSFNTLVDYLTGQIKYIVKTGYSPELIEWKDFTQNYEDKLRLISLYGQDDGTLTYAIGQYYDFSGYNTSFKPFNNYDDAFDYFKNQLLANQISDSIIGSAKKYNINLSVEKVKEYNDKKASDLQKNIESYQIHIDKCKASLEEINNQTN